MGPMKSRKEAEFEESSKGWRSGRETGLLERGINSLKWITALCQEHCRNTSDYWEDGISAFLYRLAGCQRMLFPVVGDRWLGRIGSVIEIMHFYRSFRAFSSRCCLTESDVGRYCYGRWLRIVFKMYFPKIPQWNNPYL